MQGHLPQLLEAGRDELSARLVPRLTPLQATTIGIAGVFRDETYGGLAWLKLQLCACDIRIVVEVSVVATSLDPVALDDVIEDVRGALVVTWVLLLVSFLIEIVNDLLRPLLLLVVL